MSSVQNIIQGILGSVEYALSKDDATKAERYHMKQIIDSVNMIMKGNEFKFECLNCTFKSNNQVAAIKHRPEFQHNVSGPIGFYCTCDFSCESQFVAKQHKRVCWGGKIIRFDEVRTLKSGELKEAKLV